MEINIKFVDQDQQFKDFEDVFKQEFNIPVQTSPNELNSLFASLIEQEQIFNFYSNEQLFYQDSLEQFIKNNNLSTEKTIEFTFSLSLQPPKHLQTIETKNWNSKLYVDDKYVITTDYDGNINLIMSQQDSQELKLVHTLNLSKVPITQLINIQSNIFLCGGYDGKLYIFDINQDNQVEHLYHLSNKQLSIEQIFKINSDIIGVRYENNLILTYKLCLNDEEKIQLLNTYKFKDTINICYYLKDQLVILQALDNNLILFDLASNRQLKKYKFDYLISSMEKMDETLLVSCQNQILQIKFDEKHVRILKSAPIKEYVIKIVNFAKNQFLLATLLGKIQVRDIRSSRPIHMIDLYKFDIDKKRDQARTLDCVYFNNKCYVVGSQRSVEVYQILEK